MGNLQEYFESNRYHGFYEFGDRVFGYYNKIPFVGSVGTDSVISDEEGPIITIRLDLPIIDDDVVKTVIRVKHTDIKSYMHDLDSKERKEIFKPVKVKKVNKEISKSTALLENLKKLKGKK
jgi:hypothetical protein